MITKERLEELIEQGETIYDIFKGDIYLVDLTMAKYYDVPKYIEYKNDYYNCNLTRSSEDLFETKEDARWELEMTATRTETLKMPRFESIIEPNKTFVLYEDDKFLGFITVDQQIVINYYKIGEIKRIFDKPLTKENYIEACKLCLRLFKGEEV